MVLASAFHFDSSSGRWTASAALIVDSWVIARSPTMLGGSW